MEHPGTSPGKFYTVCCKAVDLVQSSGERSRNEFWGTSGVFDGLWPFQHMTLPLTSAQLSQLCPIRGKKTFSSRWEWECPGTFPSGGGVRELGSVVLQLSHCVRQDIVLIKSTIPPHRICFSSAFPLIWFKTQLVAKHVLIWHSHPLVFMPSVPGLFLCASKEQHPLCLQMASCWSHWHFSLSHRPTRP